jgi:VanZ family protein
MTTLGPREIGRKAGRAWLWVLVWTGVTLWLGSEDFSASATSRFIGPFLRWLLPDAPEATLDRIHFFVRKGAHVVAYGLLALFALRALAASTRATLPRLAPPALAWVLVVAACDELRQGFSGTRTGSLGDAGLDLAGGVLALALAIAYTRVMQPGRAARERE